LTAVVKCNRRAPSSNLSQSQSSLPRGRAYLKDFKNPPKAALALAGALSSAKIQFVAGPAPDGFNIPDDGLAMIIGAKEEK
jgi:hypothetical protein